MWSEGRDCGQQRGGRVCARSNVEVLEVAALQVGIRQTPSGDLELICLNHSCVMFSRLLFHLRRPLQASY